MIYLQGGSSRLPPSSLNRSENDLRTENAVLREQVSTFHYIIRLYHDANKFVGIALVI